MMLKRGTLKGKHLLPKRVIFNRNEYIFRGDNSVIYVLTSFLKRVYSETKNLSPKGAYSFLLE